MNISLAGIVPQYHTNATNNSMINECTTFKNRHFEGRSEADWLCEGARISEIERMLLVSCVVNTQAPNSAMKCRIESEKCWWKVHLLCAFVFSVMFGQHGGEAARQSPHHCVTVCPTANSHFESNNTAAILYYYISLNSLHYFFNCACSY